MADFAAAQERIRARRAASSAQVRSAALQSESAHLQQLTRLPPPLRLLVFQTSRAWDAIRSPFGTSPAFRVGQVDAELLDEELVELLGKQAGEGLKLLGSNLKDDWVGEVGLMLRVALWKLSIWDHGASYGASLQGLKYVDARSKQPVPRDATKGQRAAYGLVTVGGRYAWQRWEDWLSSTDNGYDVPSPLVQRLSRFTNLAGTTRDIASFVSFLVFLYNGKYRTLTDRLLRMRLVPSTNQTSREVSFEYLNRQLVWHAFTEFLLFLLPLVGVSRWKRWISKAWKNVVQYITRLRTGRASSRAENDGEQKGELAFLPERTCAICYQDQNTTTGSSEQDIMSAGTNSGIIGSASTDITNPYETIPCACIYCYVCLTQRIEAEEGEGFTCLRCGEPAVKACKPWNGDVWIEAKHKSFESSDSSVRPPSRKSVAFADELEESEPSLDKESPEHLSTVEPIPVEDVEDSAEWSRLDDDEDEDDVDDDVDDGVDGSSDD